MTASTAKGSTPSSAPAAANGAICTNGTSGAKGNGTPSTAPDSPALATLAAAEQARCYSNFGPAYVGTGIAGDLSIELGISTGEGSQVQRSGIGFYLRSDHMAHRYAKDLLI